VELGSKLDSLFAISKLQMFYMQGWGTCFEWLKHF